MAGAARKETKICFRRLELDGGAEFFSLDLTNGGKICPILGKMEANQCRIRSKLVALNSVVYSIGGCSENPSRPKAPSSGGWFYHPEPHSIPCKDFFVFDATTGWNKSSSPVSIPDEYLSPIAHKDRIFTLIGKSGVEIYDPSSNSWKFRPLHDLGDISNPIISDPCKDRILMHFENRGIYEFRPDDVNQPLICLDPNFPDELWPNASSSVLILDDVLYLYNGGEYMPVSAYDLNRNKVLYVTWSSSRGVEMQCDEWDGFYHLGNGKLCLVSSFPLIDDKQSSMLRIVTFTVRKDGDGSTIVATQTGTHEIFVEGGAPRKTVDLFTMEQENYTTHIDSSDELDQQIEALDQQIKALSANREALHQKRRLQHNLAKIQADAMPEHYVAELEINEYPQNARLKVTHKETLGPISDWTGAAITTRGQYFPPGMNPGPNERKLFLYIEGPTEHSVKRAKAELRRVLEDMSNQALQLPGGTQPRRSAAELKLQLQKMI